MAALKLLMEIRKRAMSGEDANPRSTSSNAFSCSLRLRTGSSDALSSISFCVSSPVGKMCKAMWVVFLWRWSKVFVRLPSLQQDVDIDPESFVGHGLETVALVLDGTDMESKMASAVRPCPRALVYE